MHKNKNLGQMYPLYSLIDFSSTPPMIKLAQCELKLKLSIANLHFMICTDCLQVSKGSLRCWFGGELCNRTFFPLANASLLQFKYPTGIS